MQPLTIGSLDLDMTQKCNLSCSYCYLGQGPTGPRPAERGTMSDETLDDAVRLIQQFGIKPTEKKPRPQTHVSFYGGEPLLVWDNCKAFIAKCDAAKLNIRYTLVSNGTLGDPEIVKFCADRNIFVQRSIDGCPEAQELVRPGSIERYEAMTKVWKDYKHTRRITVTPETVGLLSKSFEYFQEQGFAPGGSPILSFYADWTPEAIATLKKEFWKIAQTYVADAKRGKPWYMYWFSREANARFWTGYKLGCGSGKQLWALCHDGWLYTCHRFTSDPHDSDFCFGSAKEILAGTAKGLSENVREAQAAIWANKRPFAHCDHCVAKEGCDGGCYHVSQQVTGNMRTPPPIYCTVQRLSAEIVTWMDRQLRPIDPHWWARGNFRAKDYLKRVGQGGSAKPRPNSSGAPAMSCNRECPQNLNRAVGACYLQAGPYQPMRRPPSCGTIIVDEGRPVC